MAKSNIRIKKICEWCGQEFVAQKVTTKYCSHRCANLAYKQAIRAKRIQQEEQRIQITRSEKPLMNIRDKECYRLHFAEGKDHVNFMRLRRHDKVKYFIYHALKREVPNARSWSELRLALRKYGIDTQWKLSRTTGEMQGVKFTCDQLTFSGSKIDRQFSFLNIDQELRYNALSATMNLRQVQAETIREEPRHEYQQENHSGISLGLFTPSPTDEAIQANRLKKKKKKPKRKRGFSL